MRQNVIRFPRRRSAPKKFLIVAVVTAGLPIGIGILDKAGGFLPSSSTSLAADQPKVLNGGGAWGGKSDNALSRSAGMMVAGRVSHVRDGDTIEVRGRPIRLAALDCAEQGTVRGDRATHRMKALVRRERLSCSLTGRKSYERWIGTCSLSDGRTLSSVMIAEGFCERWN